MSIRIFQSDSLMIRSRGFLSSLRLSSTRSSQISRLSCELVGRFSAEIVATFIRPVSRTFIRIERAIALIRASASCAKYVTSFAEIQRSECP